MEQSRAHVYTDLFRVRRYLTHAYDFNWGAAIPIVPAGAVLAVTFLEFKLGVFAVAGHLPAPLNLAAVAVLPFVAWKIVDRPVVEGRPLQAWVLSQIRYWLLEPHQLVGELEAVRERQRDRRSLHAWSPRRR